MNTEAGVTTTFGLNLVGSEAIKIPDLIVPSLTTVNLMAMVAVFVGAFHLARGIRSIGVVVGVIAFTLVLAFITWAAQDKSFNLTGMISSSFVRATPIALAALVRRDQRALGGHQYRDRRHYADQRPGRGGDRNGYKNL